MVLRFSKAIEEDHLSLYYVKAMDMLFMASSPLTDAAVQEDFRDENTKLYHFELKKEDAEEVTFPTFEEWKEVEGKFLGAEEDASEEEE